MSKPTAQTQVRLLYRCPTYLQELKILDLEYLYWKNLCGFIKMMNPYLCGFIKTMNPYKQSNISSNNIRGRAFLLVFFFSYFFFFFFFFLFANQLKSANL